MTKAQRHEIIQLAVTQRPEAMSEVTIYLWERLAVELISIIGERGFQLLYARSVHLTRANFPWLAQEGGMPQADAHLDELRLSLEGRDLAQVSDASIALLVTFCDLLTVLIGEPLVLNMLRSAWGDALLNLPVKELGHEQ